MEAERIARENEEKERLERMNKIKDQFADPNGQWEKDKTDIQNEAMREKANEEKAAKEREAEQKAATEDTKPAVAAGPVQADKEATKPQEAVQVRIP
jgi:mannan polymerase II complex ANP1 subunit